MHTSQTKKKCIVTRKLKNQSHRRAKRITMLRKGMSSSYLPETVQDQIMKSINKWRSRMTKLNQKGRKTKSKHRKCSKKTTRKTLVSQHKSSRVQHEHIQKKKLMSLICLCWTKRYAYRKRTESWRPKFNIYRQMSIPKYQKFSRTHKLMKAKSNRLKENMRNN